MFLPRFGYSTIDKASSANEVTRMRIIRNIAAVLFGLICFLIAWTAHLRASRDPLHVIMSKASASQESFDALGRFIMMNFDDNKPMSNFLAGLGGLYGVPMWTFYVNRGQGVAGFGVQNKDGAIMKFNSAEKAYQNTALTGFRTFVKGSIARTGQTFSSSPFDRSSSSYRNIESKPLRSMMIGTSEMEIQEIDSLNGLQTNVLYYTIVNEDFPGLIRQTTFTNLNEFPLDIEFLDGLAKLIPAGLGNAVLDSIGRTMEAWMNVYNMKTDNTLPFFHISQSTADTAFVQIIKEGHFVVSFIEGSNSLLPIIVDPMALFDYDTELTSPNIFWSKSLEDILKEKQVTTSRTPCSFAGGSATIPAFSNITITSIYGHADTLEIFLNTIKDKLLVKGYANKIRNQAQAIVKQITNQVSTKTSSPLLDLYTEQSYLDNVLRGGLPLELGLRTEPKIYHVFSRIHGDIERDYNNFQIEASAFSQGPGNFRDVNQNRRVDVLVNPFVQDFNIRTFLSFIQADGFNPLTVAGTNFKVPPERVPILMGEIKVDNVPAMTKLLSKPFRIGSLLKDMKTNNINSFISREDLVQKVMVASEQHFAGQFNQNGFWADHWTYTLDHIDSYIAVFPDKEQDMLYNKANIPFYMSPALMRSRADRYLVVNNSFNNATLGVRVYNAISLPSDPDYPKARKSLMDKLALDSDYVSDAYGACNLWQRTRDLKKPFLVTPIAKLAILGFLKFSSLDQSGFGVEMEGGKPGWNDAMNGLPGIIGSGMPETFEMLRIIVYIKRATMKFSRGITFPVEFMTFIDAIRKALLAFKSADPPSSVSKDFIYWNSANTAREVYRDAVNTTFSGEVSDISSSDLMILLSMMEEKVRSGISKAISITPSSVVPSYFYHECTSYTSSPWIFNSDIIVAKPLDFKLHALPIFLEGPTRQLKIVSDIQQRRAIYAAVKASGLYDAALKMFYLSESLENMGQDVGRMKAFSPGWLENQSIWLHMSYKFYLELLRGGLYEEFFTEMASGLVPFMPFKVYGRSPVEASSFIVSSAFPDQKIHGEGFLARLSGSTAEYLSMWLIMMAGLQPFVYETGVLHLRLRPVLPGWLFTEDDTVSFKFLGSVTVTYHNPRRIDTWKLLPKSAVLVTIMDERMTAPDASSISGDIAERVRNLLIKSIDVIF